MLLVNTILELPRSFQVLIINYKFLNLAFKAFTLSATYIFFFILPPTELVTTISPKCF